MFEIVRRGRKKALVAGRGLWVERIRRKTAVDLQEGLGAFLAVIVVIAEIAVVGVGESGRMQNGL